MSKNKRKKGKHYDDGKQLAELVMRAESQFPQGTGKQKRNFVVAGFMDILLDGVPKFWRGIVRALVRPFILIAIEAVLDYNDELRAIDDAADGDGWESLAIQFASPAGAGTCGKCGAPYSYPSGVWCGVVPPAPIPNCACWNTGTVSFGSATSTIVLDSE